MLYVNRTSTFLHSATDIRRYLLVSNPPIPLIQLLDHPTDDNTTTGTFADDTVILATHADPAKATRNLQHHLNLIQAWIHKWKIKINETKSIQLNFTLRREQCPQVRLNNNNNILQSPNFKYLGIHLDSRLTWKDHVTKKTQLNRLKNKGVKLANWKKVQPILRK
jgi:hypothetical protein